MFLTVRPVALCFVPIMFAGACLAGGRHRYEIDPESADGTLLQQILQDPSQDHRRELLERYVKQFPQAASAAWAQDQLVRSYSQSQDVDHLLPAAEKLLATDPADVETANLGLRAAETRKDGELDAKWGILAWDAAQRASSGQNADMPLVAEVKDFADFVLYTAAHETSDPGKKAEYFRALEQRDPDNRYASSARPEYISAVLQTESPEHRLPFLEKELARSPEDEDVLFAAAQEAARLNGDAQTLGYSLRLLAVLSKKVMPAGMDEGVWSKKRVEYISIANWFAGTIYSKQGDYGASDQHLTAALPYLQDKPATLAAAYYTLGYNNYSIASESGDPARAKAALRYNRLCANIKSPYQASAQKNLEGLKAEFHLQ
jgi:hypothetical protein